MIETVEAEPSVRIPQPAVSPSTEASETTQEELRVHELTQAQFTKFQLQQARADLVEERKYFQDEREAILLLFENERAEAKLYRVELFRSRSAYLTSFLAIALSSVGGMLFGLESPYLFKGMEFGKGAGILLVLSSLMIAGLIPLVLSIWTVIGNIVNRSG